MDDYQGRRSSAERAQNDPEAYSLTVNRPFPQLSALFGGVSLKAVNSIERGKRFMGVDRITVKGEGKIEQNATIEVSTFRFMEQRG